MCKTILFTLPTLSPTDSKLPRVLAICKALDRQRFQPLVSVDHAGRLHEEGLQLLKEAHVPVHLIRMSPHRRALTRSLLEMAGTPRVLRRSQIVIQHSSDYSWGWTEPLLARFGGVRHWICTKTNLRMNGWHWWLRLRLAKRVVVEAPQVAAHLAHAIPGIEHRLVYIPKGIDTDVFKPRTREEIVISDLVLGSDNLVLGCVAHLVSWKDHPSLLRALKILGRSDISLLLIGGDVMVTYARKLRDLVSELGLERQVHFLGRRSDVNQLHNVMDGLILPSSGHETLPYAVLEGMASGLPIITSDVGGLPDAVKNSVNGWIVPRGDDFIERLAAAISEWAADSQRRTAYGAASRHVVQERFALTSMTQGYIDLFESLLEQDAK